uniref:Uncharacterized protein n=1 Tax=Panagrolaimus davidi TaxID=227884 RepID=A0A914QZA3_9BILA
MTTKNRCFSLKDEKLQQHCINGDKSRNDQYSNLNLNKNKKCSNLNPIKSQSGASDIKSDRFKAFNENRESDLSSDDNCFSQTRNDTWNKSFKNSSPSKYLNLHDIPEQSTLKQMNESPICNKSTLLLHIAAYENSVEPLEQSFIAQKSKNNKFGITSKCVGRIFTGSNIFEFPRQQEEEDDVTVEPEVMQFKATQKLLDPAKEVKKEEEEKKSEEKKDEEKDEKKDDNVREINLIAGKTK